MKKEQIGVFRAPDKEPVIDRIAQLARKYPSRSAAARAWGININTLNTYYKKEANPPMPRENLLSRIAESEGVTLEWLKFGNDETPKKPENIDCRDSLVEMLSFLTQEERVQLTAMLARKGVETILYLLNPENQALLELTEDKKRAALRMESMSEKQFREILSKIEISTRETISEVDHSDTNIRARA